MMIPQRLLIASTLAVTALLGAPAASPDAGPIRVSHLAKAGQDFRIVITGDTGAKPKLAIPEFSVVGTGAEVQQAARTISAVLWDDIDFEDEFVMVSRDEAAKIPAAATVETCPTIVGELGPCGALGVRQTAEGFNGRGQGRRHTWNNSRMLMFGGTYSGCSLKNPRRCAHFSSPTTSTRSSAT